MNTDALYCAHCQNDDHATYACEARDTVTDAEVQCPHWSPGSVTKRTGCTACAALEAAREVRNAAH